ncbi:hypothetical protein Trydic_g95 [Trypoxylus dichotomus]
MCQSHRKLEGPSTSRLAGIPHARPASGRRTETTSPLTTSRDPWREIDAVFGRVIEAAIEFDGFGCSVEDEASIVVIHRTARTVSFILCSLYVGTLVARETTAHTCHSVLVKFSTAVALVLLLLIVGALTIASRCYASDGSQENLLLVKLQYPQANQRLYRNHRLLLEDPQTSLSSIRETADVLIRFNSSSRLVLGSSSSSNSSRSSLRLLLHHKRSSDTSLILKKYNHLNSKRSSSQNRDFTAIFRHRHHDHHHLHNSHHYYYHRTKKTEGFRNFRTKREYLTAFDNVLDFYREEPPHLTTPSTVDEYSDDSSVDNIEIDNNNNNKINNSNSNRLETIGFGESGERDQFESKNVVEIVEGDGRDVSYGFPPASDLPVPPSVRKNFQFESSTQRSMPPVHVSENSQLEYRYGKSVDLSRLSTNQAIFRCLRMRGTTDQPDHVPSNGTSDNQMAQYLRNMAGGQRETERCHAVESLFTASARIVAVFSAVLGSIASVEIDTVSQ